MKNIYTFIKKDYINHRLLKRIPQSTPNSLMNYCGEKSGFNIVELLIEFIREFPKEKQFIRVLYRKE